MKYCEQCGAELSIDTENKKIVCEYCRKEYEYIYNEKEKEYICNNCDIDFISDRPNIKYCPYCDSKDLKEIKFKRDMPIDKLILFKKTQKEFIKSYKKILRKKFFVPNIFYKHGFIKSCNSVYLPYYLCNMHVKSKLYVNTKKINNWISDNYKYSKVDDYILLRQCESDLDNVSVIISNKMGNMKINNIMPYDFADSIDYEEGILNNYVYEDCKKIFEKEKLKKEVENIVIKNILKKIRDYDVVELKNIQTAVNNFRYKRIILPLWVLNIEYKNKLYYFIMNGQTGKTYYNLPISKFKIVMTYIIFFVIIFMILVLLRSVII